MCLGSLRQMGDDKRRARETSTMRERDNNKKVSAGAVVWLYDNCDLGPIFFFFALFSLVFCGVVRMCVESKQTT